MARKEKKQNIENKLKEARYLQQEFNRLIDIRRNAGWIKLAKPIHAGYVSKLVPRADIMRRDDAAFFIGLAELVSDDSFSREKDFIGALRKTDRYFPKKKRKKEPRYAGIKTIDEKVYQTLTEKQKREFSEEIDIYRWGTYSREIKTYKLTRTHYFSHKESKHYVTKVRLILPEIESQIQKIENRIESQNLWGFINKEYGTHNDWKQWAHKFDKYHVRDRDELKDMSREIEEISSSA